MRGYAEGTTVAPEKTRAEIEIAISRYGAKGTAFARMEQQDGSEKARVEFLASSRRVRFDMVVPAPTDKRFTHDKHGWRRSPEAAKKLHAAEVRRLWRALLLGIKAKLEVVQSGLAVFEEEFMANIVLPDGMTVAQHALPGIARAYESGRVVGLLGGGAL